ncbi:MAG: leucine-rich repeat protein [Clostridia bacterium]|nr:leucine-rich repeat protein [Clostridia bacterium]
MKKHVVALALLLLLLGLTAIAHGETKAISVIMDSTIYEGKNCPFQVKYGDQIILNHQLQISMSQGNEEKKFVFFEFDDGEGYIYAQSFYCYEAGTIKIKFRVYDEEEEEWAEKVISRAYRRDDALTGAPTILNQPDENGFAILYYPGADGFVQKGEDYGIYGFDPCDETLRVWYGGIYAAVVDGKRSDWLTVTFSEEDEENLKQMKPLTVTCKESFQQGEPFTFTVDGEEDAHYDFWIEQNGGPKYTPVFDGPGTYTVDLGWLEVTNYNLESWFNYSCYVQVTVTKPGYETQYESAVFSIVPGEETEPPTVAYSPKAVEYYDQPITFTIEKEGATDYLALLENNGVWFLAPASKEYECSFSVSFTGIAFSAKVNGRWTPFTEMMYFIDLDSYPQNLEKPELEVPYHVIAGESIPLRWNAVEGAEKYDISAYSMITNYDERVIVEGTDYSLHASNKPGDVIEIRIYAIGNGYGDSEYTIKYAMILPDNGAMTLPASLQSVGDMAFWGLPVSRLNIPDGCEELGYLSFADMKNLVVMRIPASVKSISSDAFMYSSIRVIETEAGSYAEQFGKKHGIQVIHIE